MTPKKYDVVVEAVRYTPDGQVDTVRAFERRGPTFSDRVLVTRQALLDLLKRGKIVVAGEPVPFMASTFNISGVVHLSKSGDGEVILCGNTQSNHDSLGGTPLF